jgi:hypothetical protein
MGDQAKEMIARIAAMPVHAIGRLVRSSETGEHEVATEIGMLRARRAASCLLEPEPEDEVLVSGPSLECAYIIAVLERRTAAPMNVAFVGETRLSVSRGSLRLRADGTIQVEAGEELALTSENFTLRAREAITLIDRLHAVGKDLTASIGQAKLIGNLLESFVDRIAQFAKSSLRVVEGADQVRAGVADYQAEQLLSLRGRELLATADELVKIDGGQIHLG